MQLDPAATEVEQYPDNFFAMDIDSDLQTLAQFDSQGQEYESDLDLQSNASAERELLS